MLEWDWVRFYRCSHWRWKERIWLLWYHVCVWELTVMSRTKIYCRDRFCLSWTTNGGSGIGPRRVWGSKQEEIVMAFWYTWIINEVSTTTGRMNYALFISHVLLPGHLLLSSPLVLPFWVWRSRNTSSKGTVIRTSWLPFKFWMLTRCSGNLYL